MMETLRYALRMLRQRERGVWVTVIDADETRREWIGRRWIWQEESGVFPVDSPPEMVPTNCWEPLCKQVLERDQFCRERIEWEQGWFELMLEPVIPVPRLYILGCGHIGQALAWMAHQTGWPLTVIDDRPDFARPERFPDGAQVVCADFAKAILDLNPGSADYVVIVTRGHRYDQLCLQALTGRTLAYVGMIGSRRRVRELMDALCREGADAEWLHAVHSPIGLAIGAETPEEIAVSIMAEIIQVRRKGVP